MYGFHSLRHSFASSEIVDKHYTHIGNESKINAIKAVSGGFHRISDPESISMALQYISTLSEKSTEVPRIEKILRKDV